MKEKSILYKTVLQGAAFSVEQGEKICKNQMLYFPQYKTIYSLLFFFTTAASL